MRNLKVLLVIILFSSCSPKFIPIKGQYPQTPIIYYSESTTDKVWDNIIDFFAQNGISIKLIDKSSGLIISEKTKLTWSFEDKKGKIKKSDAYVILPQVIDNSTGDPYKISSVTGEWNIRIKKIDNRVSINVNLNNILATYGYSYYSEYTHRMVTPIEVQGQTTGNFEKTIYDIVK